DRDIDTRVGQQALHRDLATSRQSEFGEGPKLQNRWFELWREHRALRDRRQARAAAFDEADADLVVLARGVESGAAAALAPGGDCGLDLNAAKAALGKRFDNLLALPSEVGLVL